MSFIDSVNQAPQGIPDEEVVFAFEEESTLPPNIEELDDGGVMVDFEPQTETEIPIDLPHGANLAEFIDEKYLSEIASELIELYNNDKESRSDWLTAFTKGLDGLGFTDDERSEPFEGASGVFHPLLAEAATQFQAQAYKELLPAGGPVSTSTVGSSKTEGQDKEVIDIIDRSNRVKEFMNYYITNVMEEYDPELDQMLFYLGLSGSAFKKVYFDATLNRVVSKYITAEDLVINYAATDLKSAERITHVISISPNQLLKQQVYGFYREFDAGEPEDTEAGDSVKKNDEFSGVTRNGIGNEEYTILEMHVNLDLDGFEDIHAELDEPTGIALPYIVSICEDTSEVLSIRRNFKEGDPLKQVTDFFIHYKFLPGLGFYGYGLIHMIGGLAETATSILRQLIDAGTFANLSGGFKTRGTRADNPDEPIAPGEWRDIDVPGGNIREAFMTLPYNEPSGVLFQLLGLVIDSGRRFASIADTTLSESGSQQNPVGTTMALIERGSKVMSAIHKRLHYAQRKEFKLLATLFSETIPQEYPYTMGGHSKSVMKADFGPEIDVIPVSDPNIFSMAQRATLAQQQLQMAQAAPDIHNLRESYRRMYDALEIKNPDDLLKPEEKPEPKSIAQEHADVMQNKKLQAFEGQDHMTHIQSHIVFAQIPIVSGKPEFLSNLIQDIMQHIGFAAQAQVSQEAQQIAQQSGGQLPPEIQQRLQTRISQVEAEMMSGIIPQITAKQVDPMVAMHEREMVIKENADAQKSEDNSKKLQVDMARASMTEETKRMGIEASEAEANQNVAQRREAAHLQADNQLATIHQKALADAEKNDTMRRTEFNQGGIVRRGDDQPIGKY